MLRMRPGFTRIMASGGVVSAFLPPLSFLYNPREGRRREERVRSEYLQVQTPAYYVAGAREYPACLPAQLSSSWRRESAAARGVEGKRSTGMAALVAAGTTDMLAVRIGVWMPSWGELVGGMYPARVMLKLKLFSNCEFFGGLRCGSFHWLGAFRRRFLDQSQWVIYF